MDASKTIVDIPFWAPLTGVNRVTIQLGSMLDVYVFSWYIQRTGLFFDVFWMVTWNLFVPYFWAEKPSKTRPFPIRTRGPIWVPGNWILWELIIGWRLKTLKGFRSTVRRKMPFFGCTTHWSCRLPGSRKSKNYSNHTKPNNFNSLLWICCIPWIF